MFKFIIPWVYQSDRVYNEFTIIRGFLYPGNHQLNKVIKRKEIPFKKKKKRGWINLTELPMTVIKKIIKTYELYVNKTIKVY